VQATDPDTFEKAEQFLFSCEELWADFENNLAGLDPEDIVEEAGQFLVPYGSDGRMGGTGRLALVKCAYCSKAAGLTREHIWPDWLLQRTDYHVAYLARAGKRVSRHMTVRDVCGRCNNGPLSALDDHMRALYDTYVAHWVEEGQAVDFRYDHGLLLRWLLKVSYNSARTTGRHAATLKSYADVLISPYPVSPIFVGVFVETIMPSYVLDPGAVRFRRIDPRGARCGPIIVPGFEDVPDLVIRRIQINSYVFTLVLTDNPWLNGHFHVVADVLHYIDGVPLTPDGCTRIPAPTLNTLRAFSGVETWPE